MRSYYHVIERAIHTRHTFVSDTLVDSVQTMFPLTFGQEPSAYDLHHLIMDIGVSNGLGAFLRPLTVVRTVTDRMERCLHEYRKWDRQRRIEIFQRR